MNVLYFYIFLIIVHPYLAMWWKGFQRLGYDSWKALVPGLNYYYAFKAGAKKPWWCLLLVFPGVHVIMWMVANVSYIRRFGYFSLGDTAQGIFFPYLILWKIAQNQQIPAIPETNWSNPKDINIRANGDHLVLFLSLPILGHAVAMILGFRSNKLGKKSKFKEWGDSIVFALVAASIIRTYVFEPFQIPTGSMEKTLLVGDFLFVNKLAYGPKVPVTPMSFPLVHNTVPWVNIRSYTTIETCNYTRLPGFGKIERYDVVVFNFPSGDTAIYDPRMPDGLMGHDFHGQVLKEAFYYFQDDYQNTINAKRQEVYDSWNKKLNPQNLTDVAIQNAVRDSSDKELNEYFSEIYIKELSKWRKYALQQITNKTSFVQNDLGQYVPIQHYGIIYRPVDKRENYIKRCVGLPGDKLSIKKSILYVNGKKADRYTNQNMQYNVIKFGELTRRSLNQLGLWEQAGDFKVYNGEIVAVYLTWDKYQKLKKRYPGVLKLHLVERYTGDISKMPYATQLANLDYFPKDPLVSNTVSDFQEFTIPKKGAVVPLTKENIAWYRRIITAYEGHTLKETKTGIYIDGKKATKYKFAMNYYWLMGDNRYNSADSRVWGFVPEDHIVGKASFVWLSSGVKEETGQSGFRSYRFFKTIR